MTTVTVRRQGDKIGLILPEETRQRLGLEDGQELILVDLPDGVQLVKRSIKVQRQWDLARMVLREQAEVLEELAKR